MKRFDKFTASTQAGDTIVEVLLALLVISSVLTGAYVLTSRNSHAVRDSQEHAQATQIVQSQVEKARTILTAGGTAAQALATKTAASHEYCITDALIVVDTNPESDTNPCHFSTFYDAAITSHNNTYTFRVEWDNSNGTGRGSTQFVYRIYPSESTP